MNIRWSAVALGFLADYLLSTLVQIVGGPEFAITADVHNPQDLAILILSAIAIGIGGYVAGRVAQTDRTINGCMVGAIDVLITTIFASVGRTFLVVEAAGWVLATLFGYLSRYPVPAVSGSSRRK